MLFVVCLLMKQLRDYNGLTVLYNVYADVNMMEACLFNQTYA